MTVVRFWTSHPITDAEYWRKWFCLPKSYRLIFDVDDPEYLVVSEHIYTDYRQLRMFFRLNSHDRVSIFVAGEAISPDFNLFDYACGYDYGLKYSDRFVRKPPALFFKLFGFDALSKNLSDGYDLLKSKNRFCNFIYSNSEAHPRRDQIFMALSKYKFVDSLGPHLNNMGNRTSRADVGWEQELIKLKRPYKFSIAAENASFPGYTTEKMISSFEALTIPIYWGNPAVAAEFNPKAFVNANNLSDDELLAVVRNIDENDELYREMVSQPAMTAEGIQKLARDEQAYERFFRCVFDGRPITQKKRVPVGFWNNLYMAAQSDRRRHGGLVRCCGLGCDFAKRAYSLLTRCLSF